MTETDYATEERVPLLRMLTLADYFTMWNALFGLCAIIATSLDDVPLAFTFICLAVLMDGVDGGVARLGYGGGRLGDKLDTLSDLVSFCVAPAFIFYHSFSGSEFFPRVPVPEVLHPQAWGQASLLMVCTVYLMCGMLRLARFDYLKGGSRHDYFVGLTTPSAAIVVVSLAALRPDTTPAILILLVAAGLMISRLRLPKVRRSLTVPSIVILVVAAIVGDRFNHAAPLALLLFTLAYLVFGPGYVRRREEEVDVVAF